MDYLKAGLFALLIAASVGCSFGRMPSAFEDPRNFWAEHDARIKAW